MRDYTKELADLESAYSNYKETIKDTKIEPALEYATQLAKHNEVLKWCEIVSVNNRTIRAVKKGRIQYIIDIENADTLTAYTNVGENIVIHYKTVLTDLKRRVKA